MTSRSRVVRAAAALVTLVGVTTSACAGEPSESVGAALDGGVEPPVTATEAGVDASLVQGPCTLATEDEGHACLHASVGPFADLASGQTASEPHVVYRIPSLEGTFEVGFRPARAGRWVFFVAPASTSLLVRGLEVAPATLAPLSCEALGAAYAVDLDAAHVVWLAGEGSRGQVRLLAERASPDALSGATCASIPSASGGPDASPTPAADAGPLPPGDAGFCRSTGPCTRDDECCEYCHDGDHCH